MEFRYLECSCGTPEHTVRFLKDENFLYMTFFLSNAPWHRRIVNALKYVFGYKCRYGHFDEVVLGEEEVQKLINILVESQSK